MKKSELSKENDQIFISSRLVLHLQLTSRSLEFLPGLFPGFSRSVLEPSALAQLASGGALSLFIRRGVSSTAPYHLISLELKPLI